MIIEKKFQNILVTPQNPRMDEDNSVIIDLCTDGVPVAKVETYMYDFRLVSCSRQEIYSQYTIPEYIEEMIKYTPDSQHKKEVIKLMIINALVKFTSEIHEISGSCVKLEWNMQLTPEIMQFAQLYMDNIIF